MGLGNADLEADLESLPDIIAKAEIEWEKAKLDREKVDAMIYNRLKLEDPSRTAADLKAAVNISDAHHAASVTEILAKAEYNRLYETLMCAKKKADLRTAF